MMILIGAPLEVTDAVVNTIYLISLVVPMHAKNE